MSRRVAVVTLWPPRCITPYFLIFVIISKRVVPKGKRRDEVARSRSLRGQNRSSEKKGTKRVFLGVDWMGGETASKIGSSAAAFR